MNTTVVNLKHYEYDIYIGRKNQYYRVEESPLANPYHVGKDGNRDDCCEMYERLMRGRLEGKQKVYWRRILMGLKGKRLGCYCKEKNKNVRCHGDILVKLIEEYDQQSIDSSTET